MAPNYSRDHDLATANIDDALTSSNNWDERMAELLKSRENEYYQWAKKSWGNYAVARHFYEVAMVLDAPPSQEGYFDIEEQWAADLAWLLSAVDRDDLNAMAQMSAAHPIRLLSYGALLQTLRIECTTAGDDGCEGTPSKDIIGKLSEIIQRVQTSAFARLKHCIETSAQVGKRSALVLLLQFAPEEEFTGIWIDGLDLSGEPFGVAQLPKLRALKSLSYLNLSGTYLVHNGFAFLSDLQNLVELDLSCTRARAGTIDYLHTLKNLEILRLVACDIGNTAAPALGRMSWLKELDITNTRITSDSAAELTRLLPQTLILHDWRERLQD